MTNQSHGLKSLKNGQPPLLDGIIKEPLQVLRSGSYFFIMVSAEVVHYINKHQISTRTEKRNEYV